MANLKDIRNRIRSVTSTRKITQAMRMVAAAKVKRAEARMLAARPFSKSLRVVFAEVYSVLKNQVGSLEGTRYLELLKPRDVKSVGVVVVSSDRGLCGAYNGSIIRQAFQLDNKLRAEGKSVKYFLVGTKIIQAFKRYKDAEVLGQSSMGAAPNAADAQLITETMVKAYLDGEIDSIEVLSTEFRSMISFKVVQEQVIPADPIAEHQSRLDPQGSVATDVPHEPELRNTHSELLLEPDPVAALEALIPMYLSQSLYIKLLEATASELASRMMAMSNATNNASDMIDSLTLSYNKARQANITQEILEIVGGAEALG